MEPLHTLHLSAVPLWDLGKGKGRKSTILPLKGMVDKGHTVCYISDWPSEEKYIEGINIVHAPLAIGKDLPSYRLLFFPIVFLSFFLTAIRQALKHKPDVVYAHGTHVAWPAYLVAKLFRAKYVLRLYGVGTGANRPWRPSWILLRMAFGVKTDAYILTNDGTRADIFAKSVGVPADKLHFLKNGIDKLDDLESLVSDKSLKQKMELNGQSIILSVSRLENTKQVELIIKMMPNLIQLNKTVKLVIVGSGTNKPYIEALHQLVKDLSLKDYVIFVGAIPHHQVYNYLYMADVLINMNSVSGMSNQVLEALLCGKVVVALNTGAIDEIISNYDNGILIEKEDVEKQLPEVVNEVLQNDTMRKQIEVNAQTYMQTQWWTWEERVKYEVELVEKLCALK